jgi:hypothetical protein
MNVQQVTRTLIYLLAAGAGISVSVVALKLIPRHHNLKPAALSGSTFASASALSFLTFENTGDIDMNMVEWRSSDGFFVRYGCFDYASSTQAANSLRHDMVGSTYLQSQSTLFDANGTKTGERVLWVYPGGARVEWTDGRRLFDLDARSAYYAVAFERSKVWASQPCANFADGPFSF